MTALERAIYEWWKPELQGKNWRLLERVLRDAYWVDKQGHPHYLELPPLYINGRPNMDFWHYECEPRLEAEGCTVTFGLVGKNWIIGKDSSGAKGAKLNPDPLIALGEYLGVPPEGVK